MNNENIILSLPYIITICFSSGLFGSIVGAVCNIIIARINKRSEATIELKKNHYSINEYRYKELHKYLKNLCDLPWKMYEIQYEEGLDMLINDSNNEYEKVISIYRRGYPLLDKQFRDNMETVRRKTETVAQAFIKQLCADKQIKYDIKDLISSRAEFKDLLIESLQTQLSQIFENIALETMQYAHINRDRDKKW